MAKEREQKIRMKCDTSPVVFDGVVTAFHEQTGGFEVRFDGPVGYKNFWPVVTKDGRLVVTRADLVKTHWNAKPGELWKVV